MNETNNYTSQPVPALVRMFFERCDPEDCPIYLDGTEFDFRVVGLEHAGFEAQQVCEDPMLLAAIRDAARRWLWESAKNPLLFRRDDNRGTHVVWTIPNSEPDEDGHDQTDSIQHPDDTVALLSACLMVKDQLDNKDKSQ